VQHAVCRQGRGVQEDRRGPSGDRLRRVRAEGFRCASEFVLTTATQAISGAKTFSNGLTVGDGQAVTLRSGVTVASGGANTMTLTASSGVTTSAALTVTGVLTATGGLRGAAETFSTDAAQTVAAGTTAVFLDTAALSADRVLNIPSAVTAGAGRILTIKVTVLNADFNYIVTPAAGNIDGAADFAMTQNKLEGLVLMSDGANWFVISNYLP
ncbi:MAG TPA: hypothetical protein VM681_02930, partial [Candidatus Thermoplasmatota archaeon]|nr:hypothetical protein [Candidatus Thermoplasmatota archaeon]